MDEFSALQRYAKTRDAEAFAILVRSYQVMVYNVCRRILHDPQDVEDATQETFIRLARDAGKVRSNPGGWLHACAHSTALNLLRSGKARRAREAAEARPDEVGPEHDAGTDQEDRDTVARLVDACLAELPEEQRSLLVERFFRNRTLAGIAEDEGVSQVAIGKRLEKALEELRRRFRRHGHEVRLASLIGFLALDPAQLPARLTEDLLKIGLAGLGGGQIGGGGGLWLAGILAAGALSGGGILLLLTGPKSKPEPAPARIVPNALVGWTPVLRTPGSPWGSVPTSEAGRVRMLAPDAVELDAMDSAGRTDLGLRLDSCHAGTWQVSADLTLLAVGEEERPVLGDHLGRRLTIRALIPADPDGLARLSMVWQLVCDRQGRGLVQLAFSTSDRAIPLSFSGVKVRLEGLKALPLP